MINASGPNSVSPGTMPPAGTAPAGVPVAATPQATQTASAPATPTASGFSGTTPPTAGNSSVGGSGKKLKKPKKKLPWKMIFGGVFLVLVLVGAIAGYFLTQTNQDVRQQASVAYKPSVDDACIERSTSCDNQARELVCISGKYQLTGESCKDGAEEDQDTIPTSSTSPSSRTQCIEQLGGFTTYDTQSGNCSGTWSDFLCRCVTPDERACFTTNDQCASFNTSNCNQSNSYPTNYECRNALGDGSGGGDTIPSSSSSPTSRTQCIEQLGGFTTYDTQSGNCSGTWSDFLCRCVTPDERACFTTNDQCASFNTSNCSKATPYNTNFECRAALGDGSGGGDTIPSSSSSPTSRTQCIEQLGGFTTYDTQSGNCSGTWSDFLCRCVTEADRACFTTNDQCATFNTGNCSQSNSYPTNYECRNALSQTDTSSTSEDSLPQSSSSPTSSPGLSFADQCSNSLGGPDALLAAAESCSGTWSDFLCRCITGADLACFTTNDQCATFNTSNCQNGNNYANSNDCRAALSASGFNECTQKDIDICRQAGGNCVYNSNLNRGQCENITAGDDCTSNATCQANGGNLVCSGGRCVQPTSSSSSQAIASSSSDADGTGSCSECLGLGGQNERDCYAQCSGTIATGICTGLSAEQCAQACNAYTGATTQICAGTQEGAGTARAGEFLSCGASATNGCGQVDCLVGDELVGFVIDNSQCTGTSSSTYTATSTSTSTNTPQPTLNPTLAACGEGCSTDNNCADANHSCVEGVCRLTSNPDSTTCTEPDGSSPTPVPQPSPTPLPSPDPELASCNEACTTSADCADLNHSCQSGVCRLTAYPSSENCTEPGGTSPTPVPRTEDTPLECNDPCTSDSDCSSFNHVCHNDRCRLSTNLDNISCTEAVVYQGSTDLGQISQQPGTPGVLPSAGASDLKNWLLTGLGAIGVGAIILLLL